MVKSEDGKPKSQKVSLPAQSCYGPGFPLQPPYFYSVAMTGHASHTYPWPPPPPQHLLPPYAVPYATIYLRGGVSTHRSAPSVASPSKAEILSKSSDNVDQSLTKKLEKLDGTAMEVPNGTTESEVGEMIYDASRVRHGIAGSSDGSAENALANFIQRKHCVESFPSSDKKLNVHTQDSAVFEEKINMRTLVPAHVAEQSTGHLHEKRDICAACGASTSGTGVPSEVLVQDEQKLKRERRKQLNRDAANKSRLKKRQLTEDTEKIQVENAVLKDEWQLKRERRKQANRDAANKSGLKKHQLTEDTEKLKVENATLKDERKLKRERRKQANRDAANKSRLKKQAEIEELLTRHDKLSFQNMTLKSDLHQLTEDTEKLRLENTALKKKLDNQNQGQEEKMVHIKREYAFSPPNNDEISSGVNNTNFVFINVKEEFGINDNVFQTRPQIPEANSM